MKPHFRSNLGTLACALLLSLLARPLSAQGSARLTGSDCGIKAGVPCRIRLITEVTAGVAVRQSVSDKTVNRIHFAGSMGMVVPLVSRFGLGGVATAGYRNGNPYFLVGVRLRYHATPTIALDLTPGYQVTRPEAAAGAWFIDARLMHRDRVGISVQAAPSLRYDYTVIPRQVAKLTSAMPDFGWAQNLHA
jgi:hypothetical protein